MKPCERPNRQLWKAERDARFAGKPVICVGGGPSLRGMDLSPYKGIPTIAVNQAFKIVPWAEYLLFADYRWYLWNMDDVKEWRGSRVTVGIAHYPELVRVLRMNRVKDGGLCTSRNDLAGIDSGCLAVNLAYHLGASRIILLGYDSGFAPRTDGRAGVYTHFHGDHKEPAREEFYTDRYGPRLAGLAQRLRDVGVPVVRATPPGRSEIPYVPLPEALTCDLPPVTGMIETFPA